MFLDALSKTCAATVSIPLANLSSATGDVAMALGVGVPASVVPRLSDLGLFSHKGAEKISKLIFESSGQTFTGQWMDATGPFRDLFPKGVSVGWHRIHGHHFITDAVTAFTNEHLSLADFYSHLATDVVTKNGLPILPGTMVQGIAETLNISVNKVMPWVSLNLLDIGGGVLAVSHAGSNVTDVIVGSAEWSTGYALSTIGGGLLEAGTGVVTHNPILVGTGAANIICGASTAVDYYSQPFLMGVPVADILDGVMAGAGVAAVIGVAEALLKRDLILKQKLALLGERISTAGMLGGLSTIAVPASVSAAIGITGFKLAKSAARHTDDMISAIPLTGGLSRDMDDFICRHYLGEERTSRILSYLE